MNSISAISMVWVKGKTAPFFGCSEAALTTTRSPRAGTASTAGSRPPHGWARLCRPAACRGPALHSQSTRPNAGAAARVAITGGRARMRFARPGARPARASMRRPFFFSADCSLQVSSKKQDLKPFSRRRRAPRGSPSPQAASTQTETNLAYVLKLPSSNLLLIFLQRPSPLGSLCSADGRRAGGWRGGAYPVLKDLLACCRCFPFPSVLGD